MTHTLTFVRFLSPGSFFVEGGLEEIQSTDGILSEAFKRKNCFGFQICTQSYTEVRGKLLYDEVRFGPRSLFGTLYTRSDIKAQKDAIRGRSVAACKRRSHLTILLRSLASSGDLFAVQTRCGNWQSLNPGDKVYSPADCSLIFEMLPKRQGIQPPAPAI